MRSLLKLTRCTIGGRFKLAQRFSEVAGQAKKSGDRLLNDPVSSIYVILLSII